VNTKNNIFQSKKDNTKLTFDIINKIFSKSLVVSYSDFVEKVLYDADFGFYTRKKRPLLSDFITSPLTHPSFGHLLADQIEEVWIHYKKPNDFMIVELGGSYGNLKSDILSKINASHSEFSKCLKYFNVDVVNKPSLKLPDFQYGCIISNEFFDSLPFDRFKKINNEIKEIFVKKTSGLSTKEIYKNTKKILFAEKTLKSIPEGSSFELINNLSALCKKIASLSPNCVMITIDYGFDSLKFLTKSKPLGTLRCYKNHNMDSDPLTDIGQKDITCDVNFPVLNKCLNSVNFNLIGYTTQERFLYNMGIKKIFEHKTNLKDRQQIISLMNPVGLGKFKVYFHQIGKGTFFPSGCQTNKTFRQN